MKKLLAILTLTFSFAACFAQQQEPEMADMMRSNGKIYVVVGVILIVLIGLFVYLFTLDKKISRIERKIEDNR
jgi:CcmD family protein